MDVRMFTVGQVAENSYLFRRDGSDRALLVDPGDEPDKRLARLRLVQLDVLDGQRLAELLQDGCTDPHAAILEVLRRAGLR